MGVVVRQKQKGEDNPYWLFINHKGKRLSRKVGSFEAAEEARKTIEAKLQLGQFDFEEKKETPIRTFRQYAKDWMEKTLPAKDTKPTTLDSYEGWLKNHILPVFGNKRVDTIRRRDIKHFLMDKKNGGLKTSTVKSFHIVINSVFAEAVDDEVIPASPASNLKLFNGDAKDAKEVKPFKKEEMDKILKTALEHQPEDYPMVLLMVRTGLRIGEALGLQWNDIEWDTRLIYVQRTATKGRITKVKNSRNRKVVMSKQLKATLWDLFQSSTSGWVFPHRGNRDSSLPFLRENVWTRGSWRALLKKTGVEYEGPHSLRHTYATLRLLKDDNIIDVSKQLGHSDIKITIKIYCDWIPDARIEEIDGLDDKDFIEPIRTQIRTLQDEQELSTELH